MIMDSSITMTRNHMETYFGHVKSPNDAVILFEACRIGHLPRVQRRLSEKERQQIRSGSVFVWDEREASMRRWTDGKSWSASRVSGSFLTYREMEGKRGSGNYSSTATQTGTQKLQEGVEGQEGYRYKADGLIKQSFSIQTSAGHHLHLISYFSRSSPAIAALPSPSSDRVLQHIQPAQGMYPDSTVQEIHSKPVVTRSLMTDSLHDTSPFANPSSASHLGHGPPQQYRWPSGSSDGSPPKSAIHAMTFPPLSSFISDSANSNRYGADQVPLPPHRSQQPLRPEIPAAETMHVHRASLLLRDTALSSSSADASRPYVPGQAFQVHVQQPVGFCGHGTVHSTHPTEQQNIPYLNSSAHQPQYKQETPALTGFSSQATSPTTDLRLSSYQRHSPPLKRSPVSSLSSSPYARPPPRIPACPHQQTAPVHNSITSINALINHNPPFLAHNSHSLIPAGIQLPPHPAAQKGPGQDEGRQKQGFQEDASALRRLDRAFGP